MSQQEEIHDKMIGCLYGQAIGDALGFGTEAMSKEDVKKHYPFGLRTYDEIIQDNRRKGWPIGMWTDDTEMMLCALDAFIKDKQLIPKTLARIFLDWYDIMGHTCGILTKKAINFAPPLYENDPISVAKLVWNLKGCDNAPNGGLMRTSIIGLWPKDVVANAELLCQMTHYDSRYVGSCVIASIIIYNLVWENRMTSIDEIIKIGHNYDDRIEEWIKLAYNNNDISALELDNKESMAYTLRTLAAALWSYWHSNSFEEGLLTIVNEGGDADTNAAIAGAILGAKFNYKSIPSCYIHNLYNEKKYNTKCESFAKLAMLATNK